MCCQSSFNLVIANSFNFPGYSFILRLLSQLEYVELDFKGHSLQRILCAEHISSESLWFSGQAVWDHSMAEHLYAMCTVYSSFTEFTPGSSAAI